MVPPFERWRRRKIRFLDDAGARQKRYGDFVPRLIDCVRSVPDF